MLSINDTTGNQALPQTGLEESKHANNDLSQDKQLSKSIKAGIYVLNPATILMFDR